MTLYEVYPSITAHFFFSLLFQLWQKKCFLVCNEFCNFHIFAGASSARVSMYIVLVISSLVIVGSISGIAILHRKMAVKRKIFISQSKKNRNMHR